MADSMDNPVLNKHALKSATLCSATLNDSKTDSAELLKSSASNRVIAIHDVSTYSIAEPVTGNTALSLGLMFSRSEEQFLEHACREYRSLCAIGNITAGQILLLENSISSTICNIVTTLSQRDLEKNEKRNYQKFSNLSINWPSAKIHINDCPFQAESTEVVIQSMSNNSKLKALIKKSTNADKDSFYLEIWSNRGLDKHFNLTAAKKCGDIYDDATFSSLQWSDDCSKLLLIAEKKRGAKKSFFEQEADSYNRTSNKSSDQQSILSKGDKYAYSENWGEQKRKITQLVIVIVDVNSGDVKVADEIPDGICPGQCIWGPQSSIVFVGWWKIPFPLGLVYCENRKSAVFQLKQEEQGWKCYQLTDDRCAAHSPRITPDGTKLIYLERDEGGPHRGCERLMLHTFGSREKPSVVYDIVQSASENQIPIYCFSLPDRCWLSNGKFLVLHSFFRSDQILVAIEIATGKLRRITYGGGCWSVLDAVENIILASFSTPSQPSILRLGRMNEENEVSWVELRYDCGLHNRIASSLQWETFTVACSEEEAQYMESVLISPKVDKFTGKPPLVIWPHGGPHTVAVTNFTLYGTAFCLLGFAVLFVNYRGSIGFGEKSLKSLLGNIGTQDIADVQNIVKQALKTGRFDEDNIFIFGGSHGGFISAHLIGQYPNFYKACVMRNPVINLPAMVELTDIPDWCYTEAGFPYTHDAIPTKEIYSKMLDMSPIVHVKEVVTPVMIIIGGSDARVPPSQGRSYYRALKSMQKTVKMLWYPDDCHPINKVESEADSFINIIQWFYSHMKIKQ